MEHIELKLKLIRDLKSRVMIVPRGTSDGLAAVPRGTSKGLGVGAGVESMNVPRGTSLDVGVNVPRGTSLESIPVTDFLNTVSIMGGKEIHVIIKDGTFVIAHCKVVAGVASAVKAGWAGRSYSLLEMLREVGY